jgi:murein DD-endopeptidase MepM/ murein hydrolase activator NlpD
MRYRRYTYNTKECKYEPIGYEFIRKLKLLLIGISIAVVVGISLGYKVRGTIYDPYHFAQTQIHRTHLFTVQQIERRVNLLDNELTKLHERDNNFYRSILNIYRIDSSLWNGGTGGVAKLPELTNAKMQTLALRTELLRYRTELQAKSYIQLSQAVCLKSQELKHVPVLKPANGTITSGFGYRSHPLRGGSHFHEGMDIDGNTGDPVYAAGDGVVITAGSPESGYGLQVEIDHGFGYLTKYAHLSSIQARVGQQIKRGEIIGKVGSTGYSTGSHLHYEVIKNGVKVDPAGYIYTE